LAGFLFDLDGTLVDTEELHYASALEVLGRYGKTLGKVAFEPYIGTAEVPFWQDLQRMFDLPVSISELLSARTEEYVNIIHSASIEPLPGVLDLLHWALDLRIPMAVASSSPRTQIDASLAAAGLSDFIPVRRSGHEDVGDGRGKPNPDVYQVAAAALGVDPELCIAVEDSTTGMRSANAAGCFVINVPNPTFPPHDTSCAHQEMHSMADVMELAKNCR